MKINLVYFSCQRDVDMLKMSIASSRRNFGFNKIYVFSDPKNPITEKFDDFIIHKVRGVGTNKLYGLDNIEDMICCFKEASIGVDYVLKKDSDILDCSPMAYEDLLENKWDCFGAHPWARKDLIPEKHFNGNAYFLSSKVVEKLPQKINKDNVKQWGVFNFPEDMVISSLCSGITSNIMISEKKYLLDIFLENPENIMECGFLHCRTNTNIMKYFYKKIYDKT